MKKKKLPKIKYYEDEYFELEEAFLTNHRNIDKILRKENKW